jgi:hypothetical protein
LAKKLKHDRYLEDLCDKIKPDYDQLFTNISLYSDPRKQRKIAEIDIIAMNEDSSCDIYEVKCSYRITKAKKQLQKIRRLMPQAKKLFFFCGQSGALESII